MKLHVCEVYVFDGEGELTCSGKRLPCHKPVPTRDNVYHLSPGAYLVRYCEKVKIPPDTIALVFPRSSLLRMGTTLHTAVWDPEYGGRGVGLLVVYNPNGIKIEKGTQIAQMIFIKMTGEVRKLYEGSYQGEN